MDPQSPPGVLPRLPSSVEDLLSRIQRDQSLDAPSVSARRELAMLGEDAAVQILHQIAARRVQNFSRFIIYMAKQSDVALARNAVGIASQESACVSGPPTPDRDNSCAESRRRGVSPRRTVSPQLVALGEMDFRKAFLILSYIGRKSLEDTISIHLIEKLNCCPMVSFESEVWRNIGSKCIPESDRRKSIDWDSRKTHVYQCHIDPQGNYTFKGPYLQATKTHLQRVLGDENVLLVKFEEETCWRDKHVQSVGNRYVAYRQIAKDGIFVGMRHYQFFVFKDGGKEEKRKSPGSSPVKCYFVCTELGCAVDEDRPYILHNKSIDEARSVFMHVHTVTSVAKYMARFSLILSKTIKLDVDLTTVRVERIEDIPCMDDDGSIIYNQDGEPMIHTDGTGFISENLAWKCPESVFKGRQLTSRDIERLLDGANKIEMPSNSWQCKSLGAPPLLLQVRLFKNGCAVKGTLLVDKRLPSNTVQIRPSMLKVETDPKLSHLPSCNSLEIVGTSNPPKRTFLSRYLISLLHYGGVPKEYFLELVRDALEAAQCARYNKQAALKVALKYGDMDDYLVPRMILCGIPLDEPYLQSRLLVLMREERKGLKGGKLPVSDCYYLMGTADPTGTLKVNEVCVILESGHVSGDVLVYRHPGLHFGDIHIVTATYIKDLEKIVGNSKYAIFFSTKGPRSLADEMARGDFDGDMYWVSRNPRLLEYFTASKPWERQTLKNTMSQPKPAQFASMELEEVLFQQFLNNRFKPSYTISTAADCWLALVDRQLTLGDECAEEKQCLMDKMHRLVNIYYDAVDAPKSGQKVEVPDDLKIEMFPHFMERANAYRSTSVLGLIYDAVNSFQMEDVFVKEIRKLPCFNEEASQSCLELWSGRYIVYRQEMSRIMSMDLEFRDSLANEVIQKYKRMLYEAEEFEESTRERQSIFDEALAIYQIAYKYAGHVQEAGRCSFPWKVAGQALCMLYMKRQDEATSILCAASTLREILG